MKENTPTPYLQKLLLKILSNLNLKISNISIRVESGNSNIQESFYSFDSESEKEVQAGLTKLMKGKMAIIVAHRLSTITDCDEIIVIDKGTITERGTYAELILNKGAYAELWAHQSGGFITENQTSYRQVIC